MSRLRLSLFFVIAITISLAACQEAPTKVNITFNWPASQPPTQMPADLPDVTVTTNVTQNRGGQSTDVAREAEVGLTEGL